MAVLTVEGLTKRYPAFTLEGVSFRLEEGRIMGFIGRNGAGKTTTLSCLLDLVHPDGGEVSFFGTPLGENAQAIKRQVGFVSGGWAFYPRKKLKTITAVTRSFYPDCWDEAAYREYCGLFKLEEDKTPKQLSAGMQVKYALALALSHRAKLLVLDEPTSGLDPVSREELLEIFLELARRRGTSILFSTHITSDLEKCADDITYIKEGRVPFTGTLEEFRERYTREYYPERTEPATLEDLMVCQELGRRPL